MRLRKINLKKYPYDIDNEHVKLFEELEYATATTIERVDATQCHRLFGAK